MSLDLINRLGLWPVRILWLFAPPTIGSALGNAIESAADGPRVIVEILAWMAWFTVLVATLVPSPISLTICRTAAPAATAIGVLIGVLSGGGQAMVSAVGHGAVTTVVMFLPTVSDSMINGSAYGSERRMALKPQAFTLLGPIELIWCLVFCGLVAAPLLILAELWILAGVAALVGVAAVWFGGRILHQLARRWIVFVPAGFVIKDPMQMVDAVLFRRNRIATFGPARQTAADDDATLDLTGGALGLALRVTTTEPAPVTLRGAGEHHAVETNDVLFTPSLPGAVLTEARIRGIKIGEPATG